MSIWVLGGDARSRYAAEHLRTLGHCVWTYAVPETTDIAMPEKISCAVLPFPSFVGDCLRSAKKVEISEVLSRIEEGSVVFGGKIGRWEAAFSDRGAIVCDLFGSEPMTTQNAVPTAEGALCLAIDFSPVTLHGAKCLVVGFGRCGKAIAERLKALGSDVTVSARRDGDFAVAEALGYRTEETAVWSRGLAEYDLIFSTVPAEVFTLEQVATLKPDCVFLDLASSPAVPEESRRNLHYHLAPALPARFSPKNAGILYAEAIHQALKEDFS